jgi:hypothetical protein
MQSTMALANEMAAWQGWRHMTTASSKASWGNKKNSTVGKTVQPSCSQIVQESSL